MARFQLDRAIDTTTRGQRIQGAASAILWVPDNFWPSISTDLASSGYTVSASDYDQAAVIVTASTTVSLADNSETLVSWDTEPTNGDLRIMHSTSTNTSRLTIPTGYDGIYAGHAVIQFTGNTAGRRQVAVYANGGTTPLGSITVPAVVANTLYLTCPFTAILSATDYIEVKAYQNSGAPMVITPQRFTTYRVQRL